MSKYDSKLVDKTMTNTGLTAKYTHTTESDEGGFKKFDTFSRYTAYVKLAMDARVFEREDDKSEDVVLTFCDNSRVNNTEELWVDARVSRWQAERARLFRKGDQVQIEGKLRFKAQHDGRWRGKIYDAVVNSFVNLSERMGDAPAPVKVAKTEIEFE